MLIGTEKNPKGPNFRKARKIEKDLSGCKLSFMAPPYSDPYSSVKQWETEPEAQDIYDTTKYHPLEGRLSFEKRKEFPGLQVLRIYSSRWGFNGLPFLQGNCGYINFLIDVNAVDDLPVNENLFDNQILAQEAYRRYDLTNLQDLCEGRESDFFDLTPYRWPSHLGPLNCQWINQGGTDWLYFEDQPLVIGSDMLSWHTAIGGKHFLSCRFIIRRSGTNAGNAYRINQRISLDNYLALAQHIMSSLSLELTPEIEARRTQIQTQPNAVDMPVFGCSAQQVKDAKHVMRMRSAKRYTDSRKGEDKDHRATSGDVAAFIDQRIEPKPLPNSYPPGEQIQIYSRIPPEELQKPLIGSG